MSLRRQANCSNFYITQENKDVRLLVSHLTTAFRTCKLWERLRLLLTHPLSAVFLHILSASCIPHQLAVPSYNAISGKTAIQLWNTVGHSGKKCHNNLIDQIFLNLLIYCVQYLIPFPHKLLHNHFHIWHQVVKAVLIVLLLKL